MGTMTTEISKQTVKQVDLGRYMGKWYEIARYDNKFEKGMQGVTAEYTLSDNGKIKVVNSGYRDSLDGEFRMAIGKAKIPDPGEPGKLKVSFFLFFYGDYYILELDQVNYAYALIGSSSDKYLWILSRTPQLAREKLNFLLKRAEERGYDTEKLIFVAQPLA